MVTETLRVPRTALPYICLQRPILRDIGGPTLETPLFNFAHSLYEKSLLMRKLFRWYSMKLKPLVGYSSVVQAYRDGIEKEFSEIKGYLPKQAKNILDIGCGIAGIDALISKHYLAVGEQPNFFLVDQTGISDDIFYGYRQKASIYNDLDESQCLLEMNGISESKITKIDLYNFSQSDLPKIDFVLSISAWGLHFPVSDYIDHVFDSMAPGGRLIIDVRDNTDGVDTLNEYFCNTKVIFSNKKHRRILAVHP